MPAFVCISHHGELELKTAFLIYSLAKHLSGKHLIYVAIPEKTKHFKEPSQISLNFYKEYNVRTYNFKNPFLSSRNKLLKGDLTSNKIYALSHNFKEQQLVLLDSDIAAVRDFNITSLILSSGQDLAIKPANRANIRSWEEIYNFADQSFPGKQVNTSIDKQLLPPYFNAGYIGINIKIKDKLFDSWVKYFNLLSENNNFNEFKIPAFHRDQVALSLAINDLKLNYSLLPEEYNFPYRGKRIHRNSLPVLVHYHKAYALYSSKLLKSEFNHFLKDRPEFRNLISNHNDWKNLFGSNILRASYFNILESLRYKKYLVIKKLKGEEVKNKL